MNGDVYMTLSKFKAILQSTIEEMYTDMLEAKDHPDDIFVKSSIHNIKEVLQGLPAWPTTWDINNGLCVEFADRVARYTKGEAEVRCDEGPAAAGHWFVAFQGRFYDTECIDGVDSYWQLPTYTENRGTGRQDVLEGRGIL